jgi:hypothetical protein
MSTDGPYLYDDEPTPLHTGRPRNANRLVLLLMLGTIVVAIGSVLAMVVVRGTPDERAQEVVRVFVAALAADDTETAHGLLCDDEQARLEPDEIADAYLGAQPGEVGDAHDDESNNGPKHVEVRWDDGSTSEFVVTAEEGRRICGLAR